MATDFKLNPDGAEMVGEHAGEGTALIFLHAGVADRRMWRPQMAALSLEYHTIAYDRRGFGETTADDEPFSHVADLGAVLDHLGVAQASLIGCSQGGRIAIDFALAYPQRVISLVLIAPAISGAPTPENVPPEIDAQFDALDAAEETGNLALINELEANLWLDGPASPKGRVGGAIRDLFLDMNGIALAMPDLIEEIEPPSAYERVDDLKVPTIVIWGALDFPHVKDRCRYLIDAIAGADGREIAGTAHLPNLERSETVNELLYAFLRPSGAP